MIRLIALLFVLFAPVAGATAKPAPSRIASGTVGSDEILLELLQRPEDRRRLVAVSLFSEDTRYSLLGPIPKSIPGRVGNNLEALLALKPDAAILASYSRLDLATQLRAAGVEVLIQDQFHSIADIQQNILEIGRFTGSEKAAEALVTNLKTTLADLSRSFEGCPEAKRPRIMLYSDSGTFPGRNTSFDSAARAAGLINLVAELGLTSWAPLSEEAIAGLKPDWIVMSGDASKAQRLLEKLRGNKMWAQMPAVQKQHILAVPEALISTVSHHIAELAKTLHRAYSCGS